MYLSACQPLILDNLSLISSKESSKLFGKLVRYETSSRVPSISYIASKSFAAFSYYKFTSFFNFCSTILWSCQFIRKLLDTSKDCTTIQYPTSGCSHRTRSRTLIKCINTLSPFDCYNLIKYRFDFEPLMTRRW